MWRTASYARGGCRIGPLMIPCFLHCAPECDGIRVVIAALCCVCFHGGFPSAVVYRFDGGSCFPAAGLSVLCCCGFIIWRGGLRWCRSPRGAVSGRGGGLPR